MATLAQVRQRADNWLAARWPTVQARQETYFANHGRYWQGLASASVAPNHTTAQFNNASPDQLALHPTDQAESWLDVLNELDTPIPTVFVMDTYQSPEGHGYVATVIASYNGTVYSRSQNVGTETERTVAWHVVDNDD